VGGGGGPGGVPHKPFLQLAYGQLFKDDVNGLSFISDTSFMCFKPCGKLSLLKTLICKIDGF
jgi:hypothetical protein